MRRATLVVFACLAHTATGQWGQYRGPGDLVPAEPKARQANPGRRDLVLTVDLTRWEFWWEIHKERYLQLRPPPEPLPPETLDREILPTLRAALKTDATLQVSAALVALARVQAADPEASIQPFIEHLASPDPRIRETAVLALGIRGSRDALGPLVKILHDTGRGRSLTALECVDARTRAFAAISLGLISRAHDNLETKSRCVSALTSILADPDASADLTVAAILALGILDFDPARNPDQARMRETCLGVLERWFLTPPDGDASLERAQSHVPGAIVNLLGRDAPHDLSRPYKDLFLLEVEGEGAVKRLGSDPARAAIIALGLLCDPADAEDHPDWKYGAALRGLLEAKDRQARYLSLMALAEIGGKLNFTHLVDALKGPNLVRPWAALGLGVFARQHRDQEITLHIERVRDVLRRHRNPYVIAAAAVSLGLAGYGDGAADMRDLLQRNRQRDELAGYLCVGLALMDEQASRKTVIDLVAAADRRPELLQQAYLALGMMGGVEAREALERSLDSGMQTARRLASAARALGRIGSAATLVRIAGDEDGADPVRAAALAALGLRASSRTEPWIAPLLRGLNYRAAIGLLTHPGAPPGLLDYY